MIRINLLPPDLRGAARAGSPLRVLWRGAGWAAGGLLLLLSAALPVGNGLRAHGLERMRGRWEALAPQREKLARLQESLKALERQAQTLQSVKALEAQWAPRLNLLSDALVPQLWLTRLEYEKGKGLRVEGSALVGAAGDSGGQVTHFLQHLKEQPQFHRWFRDVTLESVEHRHIQKEEVVDFVLLLTPTG